jgi:uncharacterized protein involved in outer membrane biogenesis
MSLSKSTVKGLKITALVLALPIVAILAALLYFYTADLSQYQGWVEKKVSHTLGRKFVISGRFEPDFSLHPELIATQISLANAAWVKQPNMLELDKLRIKVDLLSLFSETFWIEILEMQGVSLRTTINEEGKANWVFQSAAGEKEETEPRPSGKPIKIPVMVKHLTIRDLDYLHQDRRDSSESTAKLNGIKADLDESDSITVAIQGKVMSETLNLKGKAGTFADLVNARPIAVHLANQFDAYQLIVNTNFNYTGKVITLKQLVVSCNKSNVRGELTFDLTAKPVISGQLRSDYLDLDPFLNTKPHTTKQKENSKYVITEAPLDLHVLQKADINIDYDGGYTAIRHLQFSNLDFQIKLKEGNLSMANLNAELPLGGHVKGTVNLQTLTRGYGVDIDLIGKQLLLAGASRPDTEVNQLPRCDLKIQLQSQGVSAHDMAAAGNGVIQLVTGAGKIHKSSLSFITSDILTSLLNKLNPFMAKEEYTNLDCTILIATIKQGIARLEPMLMTTDKIAILGEGEINLHNEKIKIKWNTKARQGLGINVSTLLNPYVRLSGTLAKPSIGLKPLEGAASAGLAATTGGLSILGGSLFNRMKGEQDYCKKIKQELRQ